jgi:hypothetical protein
MNDLTIYATKPTSRVRDPKILRSTSVNGQKRQLNNEKSKKAKTNENQIQPKEQKMKLKTQIVIIALALGVSTSLVSSQDRQPQQLRIATPTIVGVWQTTKMGVNCDDPNQQLTPPFPDLLIFHGDGTMTEDDATVGATNGYGSWQREPGSQNYSFRYTAFSIDENGGLAISGVVTVNVHLTDANSYTASATIEIFDADGNLIATFCGRSTGTRFQ